MTHLTRRQFDVLRLTAEGFTRDKVAAHMHVSIATVDQHLLKMRKALGAVSSAHAVALAYEQGILGIDAPSESAPDLSRADDGASGVGELETAKALADVLGRKVVDLHRELAELNTKLGERGGTISKLSNHLADMDRQLDSARAWAVHLEQELAHLRERLTRAGCLRPDAADDDLVRLVRDMGIVRDAEYRAVDRYAERAEQLEERNSALSSLLRGMARRVGFLRRNYRGLLEAERVSPGWDAAYRRFTSALAAHAREDARRKAS